MEDGLHEPVRGAIDLAKGQRLKEPLSFVLICSRKAKSMQILAQKISEAKPRKFSAVKDLR